MATHPFVLLVEPNPTLRGVIRSELKEEGCVVVDRASEDEALAFAAIYPGPIDLAVTDLPHPEHSARFAHALRQLPTGAKATVSSLPAVFDRNDLIESVRQVLPAGHDAKPERGDQAVFWGAQQQAAAGDLDLRAASSF